MTMWAGQTNRNLPLTTDFTDCTDGKNDYSDVQQLRQELIAICSIREIREIRGCISLVAALRLCVFAFEKLPTGTNEEEV